MLVRYKRRPADHFEQPRRYLHVYRGGGLPSFEGNDSGFYGDRNSNDWAFMEILTYIDDDTAALSLVLDMDRGGFADGISFEVLPKAAAPAGLPAEIARQYERIDAAISQRRPEVLRPILLPGLRNRAGEAEQPFRQPASSACGRMSARCPPRPSSARCRESATST